jgi:DegV family protein with EDD domain
VVTDTTTYVPPEMLSALGVRTVSLYVGWGDHKLPEEEYDDLDAFYARLASSDDLPTTSQPSVGDFESVYAPLLEAGNDVVSVHIAAGLSGTCDSAREAARKVAPGSGGRVEVVDGETGAGGLGCLVLAAAGLARDGAGIDAVLAEIHRTRARLEMWFCLDTLEYLRKGGRIGAAQAMVGTALKIKPILTFGTEIAPVDKVRTKARALDRMECYLRELHDRGATEWIVQHAQSPEDAERMCEAGRQVFGSDPLFCTQVGPVLGAHLGAGLLVGGLTAGAESANPA